MKIKNPQLKYYYLGLVLLISTFFSYSCKEESEEIIPNVRFTTQIDFINIDPAYTQSNPFIVNRDTYGRTIGTAGVAIFMLTADEYYAFDIMCPYEKSMSSLVELEEDGINCICPTCGSVFSIANEYGGVLEGPSKWPLKKYNTEVRNGNLHIWN